MPPSDEEAKTNTDTDAVDNQVGEESTEVQTIDGSEEVAPQAEEEEEVLSKGVKKRFAKLTKEKYAQQDRIDALEQKISDLSKPTEVELTKADFGDDEEAFLDYKVEQKLKAHQNEQAKTQQENQMRNQALSESQNKWQSKVDTFVDELPDYSKVIRNSIVELTQADVDAIQGSSIGPKLAYTLAKDEDLATTFNSLSTPRARDLFLMKLELKLEGQVKAPVKAVSKASAPTPKLGKSGGGGAIDPNTLPMDEWVKLRNAGKI